MKERPILFSGPMARAILGGSKTQTRRVVKGQTPEWAHVTDEEYADGREFFMVTGAKQRDGLRPILDGVTCPYGQFGDRLWVRETWQEDPEDDGTWHYTQYMGCKGSPLSDIPTKFRKPEFCIYREGYSGPDLVWRPSIHMPRWASRILLEIVSVRVERLQDISDQDAIAEGIGLNASAASVPMTTPAGETMPRAMYRELWESINGAGSWDANPWVWVVEFKRVTP